MQGGLLLVLGVCSYSPGAHVLRICEWLFLASSWAGLWSFFVPEKTIKVEKVFFIWDRSGDCRHVPQPEGFACEGFV